MLILAHDDSRTAARPRLPAMNTMHAASGSTYPRGPVATPCPGGGGTSASGRSSWRSWCSARWARRDAPPPRAAQRQAADDAWVPGSRRGTSLAPAARPADAAAAAAAAARGGARSPCPARRPAPPVSFERPAGGWAVETHGLTKRFGATVAVNDVELLVPRGSAFGYLGPNGAGKTTLIRTLLGLTRADGGTMSLLGIPVPAERSRALARVGAIVDEPRFHPHLTGRDNLRLLAAARGGDAAQRIAPSLERVGLAERADDKVASYSMGMRQRLGVACVPARRPGAADPGRADERARPGRACTRCGR